MSADEIIKAAPELLKHGAELVGALKLSEITKTILGPATGEFAERVKDEIRLYRFGRQLELLKKAEKMVKDAEFTPKAVPIKLLFPLLEGASLEEDEDLHTMWAALLANASSPENAGMVRPGFIAILKQMSPDEALVLAGFIDGSNETFDIRGYDYYDVIRLQKSLGFVSKGKGAVHDKRFLTCVGSLLSEQLVAKLYWAEKEAAQEQPKVKDNEQSSDVIFSSFIRHNVIVTERGRAFLQACRPPKPQPKS